MKTCFEFDHIEFSNRPGLGQLNWVDWVHENHWRKAKKEGPLMGHRTLSINKAARPIVGPEIPSPHNNLSEN